MRTEISEDEAIRTILREAKCSDFVDVANLVQERFGLRVGAARVEQVACALKEETPESRQSVLRFVESMGGFDAARAAIADLENSLRHLMK